MEIFALAQTLTIAQAAQSNVVELSECLIDVALEHDQLIAKRNHKPRGATETRKINHIHHTKGRTYVTEDKSQDFKNKSTDHCKHRKAQGETQTLKLSRLQKDNCETTM